MKACALAALLGLCVCVSGCTGTTVNPPERDRFGLGLDSQDFHKASQEVADGILQLPSVRQAKTPPRIAFVQVQNKSGEYIDGDAFLRKIRENLLTDCGDKVVFLDRVMTKAILDEQDLARSGLAKEGAKGKLEGVDWFLTGTIDSIDRVEGSQRSTFFRVSFRLVHAAGGNVLWEHGYEVKRRTTRGVMYQ